MTDLGKVFGTQDVDAMVRVATDLVDIPSETGMEGPIGDYTAGSFADLGCEVTLQEVEEGRNNVIARWGGRRPGPTLMFLSHFDTTTNPGEDLPRGYQPHASVEDDWIVGLGISNMKCAFAGFWSAMQMLNDANVDLSGEILMCGVVGEIEKAPVDIWQGKRYRGGGAGARSLMNHGITADFCINGEPTALRLQTGNAGYLFVRIGIKGLPQHTYAKDRSINPFPKAFRVHEALMDWESTYRDLHPHPLMNPLISVGGIYGGYPFKPSITPPFCNLYVHFNLVPGQSILGTKREIEALLASLQQEDPELDASVDIYLASNGYEIPDDHPLVGAVASAHRAVFDEEVPRPNPERYSVSSDNSPLFEFGIPGITYGAGGINLSGEYSMYEPGLGEVVSIDNLAACARVYATAAIQLLSAGEDR
jgi:acetylornithine deacetylase/succinyl-diaminopimelate desuccinylase-like protein